MAENRDQSGTAQSTRPARTLIAIAAACSVAGWAIGAESPYLTVQTQTIAVPIEAYAQVEPIAVVPIKAPAAGTVSEVTLLPGAAVKSGEVIAKLTGPEVDAAIARSQAAVKSATANRVAAQKTLAITRAQLASHLSTAQQVARAEADMADATGALITAKAGLETATLTATLRSPVRGIVVALNAGTGERVATGDTLLTIEPTGQLWATAKLYSADSAAVHTGQTATFQPALAGTAIAIQVVSIAPTVGGSGGVTVGFRAVEPKPGWRSGEYGNVVIQGSEIRGVAVPTQALILDQGKWWVLVHTAEGDNPVEVVPGPSRGWQTFIRRGLNAGTQIVAQNAYLEFHRGIASRYQPPD